MAGMLMSLHSQPNITHTIFSHSTFTENSGRNGIVSIGYSPVKFLGNNVFESNIGASIRVSFMCNWFLHCIVN